MYDSMRNKTTENMQQCPVIRKKWHIRCIADNTRSEKHKKSQKHSSCDVNDALRALNSRSSSAEFRNHGMQQYSA